MARRINFNGETFTFLFRRIFFKATGIKKDMTNQDIKDYIEGKGEGAFFGNKSPASEDDECYPKPGEKNGFYIDDIGTPPLKANLKTWILENKEVKNILKRQFDKVRNQKLSSKTTPPNEMHTKYQFQGRRLHELYKVLFDKDKSLTKGSSNFYGEVFLKYVGFDSEFDLENELNSNLQRTPNGETNSLEATKETTKIEYCGYFYSFIKHDISNFYLEIDYSKSPILQIRQIGFHDHDLNPYNGTGELKDDGKIFVSLSQEKTHRKFEIIVDSGMNPAREKAMLCSILTISTYNKVVSIEGIIVKSEVLESDDRIELNIKRYLFLHRYCFRLQGPKLNLYNLHVRQINIHDLKEMVGTFRVWRFDNNFNIVQSKMVINEFYRGFCYTNQYDGEESNYNIQYCVLSVTNHSRENRSLCITTYPTGITEVISQIVLKVLEPKEVLTAGVMTLTNQYVGFPSSRAIAILKEKEVSNIELKTIENDKIEQEIEGDSKLTDLHKILMHIQTSMCMLQPVPKSS